MIVVIDNYDSFTYNLVHFLGELGAECRVWRNDRVSPEEVLEVATGIVLSPGPRTPDKAGICLDLVTRAAGQVPMLGVCLGHQTIGQAFGARVVGAPELRHGKLSKITNTGSGVFEGLPSAFMATRYHSLTLAPESVPDCLEVTATTEDGVIMGLSHRDLPLHGVQFHPESIASEHGHRLLANFLTLSGSNTARSKAETIEAAAAHG